MSNRTVTDLPEDISIISGNDYFYKIKGSFYQAPSYKVNGNTILGSFGNLKSIGNLANGTSIAQVNSNNPKNIIFNTLNSSSSISVSNNSNIIGLSLNNTAFITQAMLAQNVFSDKNFAANTITGSDIAPNAVQYSNISSNAQIKTAKAWVNFYGGAIQNPKTPTTDTTTVNNSVTFQRSQKWTVPIGVTTVNLKIFSKANPSHEFLNENTNVTAGQQLSILVAFGLEATVTYSQTVSYTVQNTPSSSDSIKVTANSSTGTWYVKSGGWNAFHVGVIYFITSKTLGYINQPVQIASVSSDGLTATFTLLNGNYGTGFAATIQTVTATALGNTYTFTTDGIRSCYNVASITRNAASSTGGLYDINFSIPMNDSFYTAAGIVNDPTIGGKKPTGGFVIVNSLSPQSCTIETATFSPISETDLSNISLVVFGN